MYSAQAMSALDATASHTSAPIRKGDLKDFAVQAFFTTDTSGDIAGTLTVQCSNDASHWVDIPGAAIATTSSAGIMANVLDAAYEWIQIVWTATSGTAAKITVEVRIIEPIQR